MTKRLYTYLLCACVLFTACSDYDTPASPQVAMPQPVAFDTYFTAPRATRAIINNTADLQAEGFGVFAYYTASSAYSPSIAPNFMYNQYVHVEGSAIPSQTWTYSPVKYWPNGTDAANGNSNPSNTATEAAPGCLSFFAYAPFREATPATGAVTGSPSQGIGELTSNSTTGDPKVKYTYSTISYKPSEVDDLLWGVAATSNYQQAGEAVPVITSGLPLANLTKPSASQTVKFRFHHALCKLRLNVRAVADELTAGSNAIDSETRILVEEVTVSGSPARTAWLNLNNDVANVARWESGEGSASFTGISSSDYNSDILCPSDLTTQLATPTNFDLLPEGVTNVLKPVFANGDYAYLFMPQTTTGHLDALTFTVRYKVITRDPALVRNSPAGFSIIENNISNTVTLSGGDYFKGGHLYNVNLLLGMTSVKFNVNTVDDWTDGSQEAVDVPINVVKGT